MIDKRIKMDCPFCHTQPNNIELKSYGKYIEIACPICGCKFNCYSKQEAIDKWNCR